MIYIHCYDCWESEGGEPVAVLGPFETLKWLGEWRGLIGDDKPVMLHTDLGWLSDDVLDDGHCAYIVRWTIKVEPT